MQDPSLQELPRLIAILRGVAPDRIEAVADVLISAGIRGIEVPLNSPSPFDSIEILTREFADQCWTGAGTVVDVEQVRRLSDVGGKLCISPNTNPEVISLARASGQTPIPGVATATEVLSAIEAGAAALKLFPASTIHSSFIKQVAAITPGSTPFFPVGGIDETRFATWLDAGAYGFGIGTNIYHPQNSLEEVRAKALHVVNTFNRLCDQSENAG